MDELGPFELPSLKLIKKLREDLKWTQKQLGKRVGVRETTISKIEKGAYHPSYMTLKNILDVLNQAKYGPSKLWDSEVWDFASKPVETVSPTDTVLSAISKMQRGGYSQLPVIEDNEVLGTITETSILIHALRPNELLSEISGPKMPIVSSNTKLLETRRLLTHEPAVLIERDDAIRGILTKHDIFSAIVKDNR